MNQKIQKKNMKIQKSEDNCEDAVKITEGNKK